MENFSCPDLRAMDRLWVKYSNGRFGFSVQKRIYQSLGGTKEYNREVWLAFIDKTSFVTANEIKATYNINAPEGHLPWDFWLTPSSAAIMPRILNCNL
jgi:GUN4-like.